MNDRLTYKEFMDKIHNLENGTDMMPRPSPDSLIFLRIRDGYEWIEIRDDTEWSEYILLTANTKEEENKIL